MEQGQKKAKYTFLPRKELTSIVIPKKLPTDDYNVQHTLSSTSIFTQKFSMEISQWYPKEASSSWKFIKILIICKSSGVTTKHFQ